MNNITRLEIIFSGNICALNGAANFVRLMDEKSFWKDNGYDLSIVTNCESFHDEQLYRRTIKYRIRSLFKKILNITIYGKRQFIKYEFNGLGKSVVNKIVPMDNTCYLLNDYMAAYQFYKRYGKKYKTIFLMHNNGNMLSMVDNDILNDKKSGRFLRNVEIEILSKADIIVFVSETAKQSFLMKQKTYGNKAVSISIGIKERSVVQKRKYDYLKLVTVGTLGDRKNQIAIIKAVEKIVLESNMNIELTLVGDGPKLKEWEEYINKHCLQKYIHIVGAQNNVGKYLDEANVFVMSSLDEGLPVSAQEAMQSGLPLVLTDVGGCNELIDGNGYLVRSGSVDELVLAIKRLENNMESLNQMGERSSMLFKMRYSQKQMLLKYVRLIKEL